jgi:3-oxoacyl-[acyl-carrier protein] reductase
VAVADINPTTAESTVEGIRRSGGQAVYAALDVADEGSCEHMAAAVVREFGRVDILVNNAALSSVLRPKPFWDWSVEEWDQVMNLNARGVWLVTRAVLLAMRERGYGRIVNVASGLLFTAAQPGYFAYIASKGAVLGMTRSSDLALKRFGEPEDLVGVVAFLASDDSRFVTGQTIVVDGGVTLH